MCLLTATVPPGQCLEYLQKRDETEKSPKTCLKSDRPDGHTAHPRAESHAGLIPVSGVGVAVDGEKKRGNGVEGTFNKDMTNDEMTFLTHRESSGP